MNFPARVCFLTLLSLCAAGACTAFAAPGVSDLSGSWKFDEGSGASVYDSSNNKSTGTLQGGAQWTTGVAGSALRFDGVDDRVRISSSSAFNAAGDFTIDLWLKPGQWGTSENIVSNNVFRIFHRGSTMGDYVYLLVRVDSADSPGDSAWGGWGGVETRTELKEGSWYHIAALKSGTTMAIYLNGIKEGEHNVLQGYTVKKSDMGPLYIGGDGKYFNGTLDEVRIWDLALSSSDILGLYQYPPNLIVLYDQTVHEGSRVEFVVNAVSASGLPDTMNYSAAGLPPGASFTPLPADELFDPYISGRKFTWTPAVGQTGTFPIKFSATDGASPANEQTVTVTVKPNSLLHGPYGSFMCRGDGEYVEDVRRDYGADANATGEPLGGGTGYSQTVASGTADYFVTTKAQLFTALTRATSGQVVYIADEAQFDLTGSSKVVIPGGVTLAGGRGRNGSPGALLFCDKLDTQPLFMAGGESVRLTGLRLRGPDQNRRNEQMLWLGAQVPDRYYDIPNSRGIQSQYPHLVVDNCELCGWSHGAVVAQDDSYGTCVHHNYIHHNQRSGLGYGVIVYNGTSVLIEGNVFDWNRHSIAGERGLPGGDYEARYNIDLGHANSHVFDMHGGNDVSDPSVPAGNSMRIHHNTFYNESGGEAAVRVRGVPLTGCWVYNNWALHDPAVYSSGQVFVQSLDDLPGHTPYENMQVYDNVLSPAAPAATGRNFSVPSAPRYPAAAAGAGTVTLTWVAPETGGSRPVEHYRIYRDNVVIATTGPVLTFTDTGLTNGTTYSYQVVALSSIGEGARTAAVSAVAGGAQPADRLESRAYPNPADLTRTDRVRITYSVPVETKVSILIYDISGDLVKTLVHNEALPAGKHYADWFGDTDGGRRVSSGMYLAVVKAGSRKITDKIAVVR